MKSKVVTPVTPEVTLSWNNLPEDIQDALQVYGYTPALAGIPATTKIFPSEGVAIIREAIKTKTNFKEVMADFVRQATTNFKIAIPKTEAGKKRTITILKPKRTRRTRLKAKRANMPSAITLTRGKK